MTAPSADVYYEAEDGGRGEDMLWWNGLSSLQQFFYVIAIPATVLLLIQTILLFFGFGDEDSDGDVDSSADGIPDDLPDGDAAFEMDADDIGGVSGADAADLRLFSVRGIISFFVVTGWCGVIFSSFMPPWLTVLLALVLGAAGLYLTAKLFQWSRMLQSSGNIRRVRAVGQIAEVYIPVPASRRGTGRIMVLIQERLTEQEAITDSRQTLPTGSQVIVRQALHDGLLLVEPIRQDRNIKG